MQEKGLNMIMWFQVIPSKNSEFTNFLILCLIHCFEHVLVI